MTYLKPAIKDSTTGSQEHWYRLYGIYIAWTLCPRIQSARYMLENLTGPALRS